MEPLVQEKRFISSLVPYRVRPDDVLEFYVQKRALTMARFPGKFALFGGGFKDNENHTEALMREIAEELRYVPRAFEYFSRYEAADAVVHVFMERVGADFESLIEVLEGEYGIFMSIDELRANQDVSLLAKAILIQMNDFLLKRGV